MTKQIFLSCAGFTIKVVFKDHDDFFGKDLFIQNLENKLKGFVLTKRRAKIDATVIFKYRNNYDIFWDKKNKKQYLNYLTELDSNIIETYYHISDQQFRILLRFIIQKLLTKNRGVMIHCSAIKKNNNAYIFLGKSGSGKSTISQLLKRHSSVLADDIAIIRKNSKGEYLLYQTPFIESNMNFAKNHNPSFLKQINVLKKSTIHKKINITDYGTRLSILIKQIFTEENDAKEQITSVMNLASDFNSMYYLYFSLEKPDQLWKLIYEKN